MPSPRFLRALPLLLLLALALAACGTTPLPTTTPPTTDAPPRIDPPIDAPTPVNPTLPVTPAVPLPAFTQFGTAAYDTCTGLHHDPSGTITCTGVTEGTLPGQTSAGNSDYLLARYTTQGTWNTTQFGTPAYDDLYASATDTNGNVYLVGSGEAALPGCKVIGSSDVYLIKVTPDGTTTYRQFGTTGYEEAYGVTVDHAGTVYLTGITTGTFDGNTTAGNADAFVSKIDPTGEITTWQFGSSDNDAGVSVMLDPSGHVVVAGTTQGTLPTQHAAGYTDAFVARFDAAGQATYTQFGTSGNDVATAATMTATGRVVIVGSTEGTLPGENRGGNGDAFLVEAQPDGSLAYHQVGTAAPDGLDAVTVDTQGNAIAVGSTHGALPDQTSRGGTDVLLVRLTGQGTVEARQFGTTDDDSGHAVTLNDDGHVIVGGETYGALPGATNAGDADAFVANVDW
ncbi:hypothetical protein [Deinococcus pimensis]|uniref:hypothetical protein n=1 Tax=Deinococcus pimensis TaxID=309888 RepID=UPI0004834D15|nr:hypothetical protein [Deinococcus pimensis]